ncbi:MAG: type III glutamate--ammonia ligase [Paracoccaceae bacterium]|nr:type III glutamate--ammonia ligase [Paracoccaceae bacterium]MXZ49959.1 type III glutamate--ammonia ligase [Paracoccaceae bacterium]MYF46586.1 type III glutamate--ammonia ligase [Paracoccaceae bacterium]MYG09813.1 type III glutamate--ammonia ligase [Paracoccaceae bacterium]MYI92552.1 type III glutamate--ammonia ligase [Paracoccaceae bacterium]
MTKDGIRYYLVSFTDLFGVVRSKLVPAAAIDDMREEGAGFAGFAAHLDMTPAHPDMLAMPSDNIYPLPWKPEVAWIPSDLRMDDQEVDHAPRLVLKRLISRARDMGYKVMTGVEPEFFLLSSSGDELSDDSDTRSKPCYDQQALMRRYDVISEISDAMISMGWEPYQNDHEDANGQFEMNWGFTDPLTTADRHTFFKVMVKSLAEIHGFKATFMPKPMANLTGNGCHVHLSIWDAESGKNLMKGDGELGLSKLAYNVIGGLLENAKSLALITNPVVNSYKRINAPRTTSGATWSPNTVTYGGNNRTHMIRIPGDNRVEVRLADGATNPYLLQAAMIASALDGIERNVDPGERIDLDMYAEGYKVKNAPKLPLNMLDSIRLFESSDFVGEYFGKEFHTAYSKLKGEEWDEYMRYFSVWEKANALDV